MKPRLAALKPRVQVMAGNRLQLAPKPSQAAGYRIRGRKLMQIRAEHFRRNPLCVMCLDAGPPRVSVATDLDHIVALTNGGTDTEDNRQGLCSDCHAVKTLVDLGLRPGTTIRGPRFRLAEHGAQIRHRQDEFNALRFPPDITASHIPCVMVCGPPNGGKHPYVLAHAGPHDVVIDMDDITSRLSGLPVYEAGIEWLPKSLAERNRQLRALATDYTHERAWFLINAPDQAERALWAERLRATIVLMAPPLDECLRRIKAETYREGYTERMIVAAQQWWKMNDGLVA